MSFDIGIAIRKGIQNVLTRNGVLFTFLLAALYVVFDIGADTLYAASGDPYTPLAMTSSVSLGAAIITAFTLLSVYLSIVIIRLFTEEETDSIPDRMYKQDMLWPMINFMIGSVAFALIVTLGLFFLIIPGIFLLVALYFYTFKIAVQNENFIDALIGSYNLTSGKRWRLFGLGLIVSMAAMFVTVLLIPLILISVLASTVVALVALIILNVVLAFIYIAMISIAAQAYNMLLEDQN